MAGNGSEGSGHDLTFIEHFSELRRRIFHALLGVAAAFAVISFFMNDIMERLLAPYYRFLPEGQQTVSYIRITEVFFIYMKIAAVLALFAASPWVFYQLWRFISPGLRKTERHLAVPFILATSLFFLGGMVFCYIYILPVTFSFFLRFNQNYTNIVTLTALWGFEIKMLMGIALTFETPILIFFLTRFGLVSTRTLLRKWRWVVVAGFIAAAVLTPSGDPVTQSLVAAPILVLYVLGIFVSWIFRKRTSSYSEEAPAGNDSAPR